MLRAVWAVAAGYLSMAAIVIGGTAVAALLLLPGGLTETRSIDRVPADFLMVNIATGFAAAVAGGWLTARLAPPASRLRLVWVLASITAVMAVATTVANRGVASPEPAWYRWLIPFVGIGGIVVGGRMFISRPDRG